MAKAKCTFYVTMTTQYGMIEDMANYINPMVTIYQTVSWKPLKMLTFMTIINIVTFIGIKLFMVS